MKARVTSAPVAAFVAGMALSGACLVRPSLAATQPETVIHLRDGRTILLSRYRGHWVLINYWATWCGDCIQEIPTLNRIASNPLLTVLGLSDEHIPPAAWTAFLAAHPLKYPVALVDRATLPPQLAPTAFLIEMRPISYLVRPDGSVARRFIGAVDPAELETLIAPATGKR